jgi:serine/threonine protein kinase
VDRNFGPFGDVSLGEVIGGYRLDRLLGAGSTSQVFLGTHVRVGRMAAIKVVSNSLIDNKDVISRLLQEARVVNDIRHPNIIDIFDFVETESPPRVALVMEYIEGPSLKAIRDVRLNYDQAIGVAMQLIDAVEAAHAAGVIHRDIKPDNLLLTKDPTADQTKVPTLKIVDFGIAKLAGSGGKTATGMMLGTPAYMAPEQVAGRPPASTATDVFAIGEVIYELLTGTRAYPAAAIHETVRAKLRGDLPPLKLPADTPGEAELLDLVKRCLASKPQERPPLAEVRKVLLDASRSMRGTSISSRKPPIDGPPSEPRLSHVIDSTTAPYMRVRDVELVEGPDGPRTIELDPPLEQSAMVTPARPIPAPDLGHGGALTEQLTRARLPPIAETEVMRSPSEVAARRPRIDSSPTNKVHSALTVAAPLVEDSLDEQPATIGLIDPKRMASASGQSAPSQLEKEDTEEFGPEALHGLMQPAGVAPLLDGPRSLETRVEDSSHSDERPLDPLDASVTVPPETPPPRSSVIGRAPNSVLDPATPNEYAKSLMDYSKQLAELAKPPPGIASDDAAPRTPEPAKSPAAASLDHPKPEHAKSRVEHPRPLADLQRSLVDYPRSLVDYPRSLTAQRGHPGRVRRSGTHPALIAVIAALLIIATGLVVLNVLLASSEGDSPKVTSVSSHVMVSSNPSGARVENAETREALGFTPIDLDPGQHPGLRRVRIISEGYKPAELVLSHQHPRVSVELEQQKR